MNSPKRKPKVCDFSWVKLKDGQFQRQRDDFEINKVPPWSR